jgi:hypothetical protein
MHPNGNSHDICFEMLPILRQYLFHLPAPSNNFSQFGMVMDLDSFVYQTFLDDARFAFFQYAVPEAVPKHEKVNLYVVLDKRFNQLHGSNPPANDYRSSPLTRQFENAFGIFQVIQFNDPIQFGPWDGQAVGDRPGGNQQAIIIQALARSTLKGVQIGKNSSDSIVKVASLQLSETIFVEWKQKLVADFAGQVVSHPWSRVVAMWIVTNDEDLPDTVLLANRMNGGNPGYTASDDYILAQRIPLLFGFEERGSLKAQPGSWTASDTLSAG